MRNFKKLFVAATLLIMLVSLSACGGNNKPDVPETSHMSFLKADGADVVFEDNGEIFTPKGINAGGFLVREGWMCPIKGEFIEGNDEYYDKGMYETLVSRFGREKAYELEALYLDNWWTSADFDRVKAAGFNHIRLNFSYMNFYYVPDGERRPDAFSRIDWFIEECAKRGLYVVLDMHGAFGSQNGRHHSGDITQVGLYSSEDNMQKTEDLWVEIATRYKDNPTVFAYDLLNEPEGEPLNKDGRNTGKLQFDYYDRLYKAIRAVDKKHIIMTEACWDIKDLPNPSTYGWENVVYQLHIYNWQWQKDKNFWGMKSFYHNTVAKNYGVPVYVGEWNCFSEKAEWNKAFEFYETNNIGWCIWTYKTCNKGNWSLYGVGDGYGIADIVNDSEDEIAAKFAATKTDTDGRYALNKTLYDIIAPHLTANAETVE